MQIVQNPNTPEICSLYALGQQILLSIRIQEIKCNCDHK